jgi:drug/metabolite transporter (DMT)-like permease
MTTIDRFTIFPDRQLGWPARPAERIAPNVDAEKAIEANTARPVERPLWLADACLLATTLIWGVNILVFKYSIEILDPVVFNATRLVFSTITLGFCAWLESRWRGARLWPHSTAGQSIPWNRVVVFSLLTGLLYMVLFLFGVARTTAGNTALLLASMPMWTAVLSFVFLKERLLGLTWVGLGLTFAGAIIVTLTGGKISLGTEFVFGNLLVLGAALCWAISTVISPSIQRCMSPLQLAFIASLLTTPIHIAWSLSRFEENWQQVVDPWMLAAIVFSGAFSTGLAYALWNAGVKILGGSHAAVYQNIVTLVAVCGGWLILREPPVSGQILGGLTIIIGVLVIRRSRR